MRSVHFLTVLSCLALLAPWAARAGDYKYPQAAPELVVTLPDGWKPSPEQPAQAQLLMITTPQDAAYAISFMALTPLLKAESRNAVLIGAANGAAKGSNMTDIKVSEVTEEKIAQGLRTFALVHVTGKIAGTEATFVFGAFTLKDGGRSFLIGEAGPNTSLVAHKAEFQKIANSIQPVDAGPLP